MGRWLMLAESCLDHDNISLRTGAQDGFVWGSAWPSPKEAGWSYGKPKSLRSSSEN
jgi:hypothetical protein